MSHASLLPWRVLFCKVSDTRSECSHKLCENGKACTVKCNMKQQESLLSVSAEQGGATLSLADYRL